MKLTRSLLGCLALIGAAASSAQAQTYPDHAVHIIVTAAPGGGLDLVSRIFADFMQNRTKNSVVIDNKAGAEVLLGTKFAATQKPDGYSILFATSISAFPVFTKNPGVDVAKDFEFVSMVMRAPQILTVSSKKPYPTVQALIAAGKAAPGKLNYTTYGQSILMMSAVFNQTAGIVAVHIPYSKAQDSAQAIVRGDADYFLASLGTLQPWMSGGEMKLLAVTSKDRNPNIPDIPSLPELGVNTPDMNVWMGVFAPRGTPKDIVEKLNALVADFCKDADQAKHMRDLGFEPHANSPEAFKSFFEIEQAAYVESGRAMGIQPQ